MHHVVISAHYTYISIADLLPNDVMKMYMQAAWELGGGVEKTRSHWLSFCMMQCKVLCFSLWEVHLIQCSLKRAIYTPSGAHNDYMKTASKWPLCTILCACTEQLCMQLCSLETTQNISTTAFNCLASGK